MANVCFMLVGLLLMLTSGCAVNDMGMVDVRYFENTSSYLITRESWGGYLSTRQADGGLTIGHMKRLMIYPKAGKTINYSVDELLRKMKYQAFEMEIDAKEADLKGIQPYAWIERNQGVVFRFNVIKTGFSVGMDTLRVMRLPSNSSGVFMFDFPEDGSIKAIIQESSPTIK